MLNGRVLRHAKVIVSSGSPQTAGPADGEAGGESNDVKNS